MRALRRRVAAGLLAEPRDFDHEGPDLLNFFEALAYMVRGLKVIREEEAWSAFASWLIPYVAACRPDIDRYREVDRTVFDELMNLEADLAKHDAGKRHMKVSQVRPTGEQVTAFLRAETRLTLDADAAPNGTPSYRRGSSGVPIGKGTLGRLLTIILRLARPQAPDHRRPDQP